VRELDDALSRAVSDLKRRQRAVTREDYEWLATALTADSPPGRRIVRAACFDGVNLESPEDTVLTIPSPGHVSVVIVPDSGPGGDGTAGLVDEVRRRLEPMRLLGTRLHVVEPRYLRLAVGALLGLKPGFEPGSVRVAALQELEAYFDPLPGGGPDQTGWPFGRALYVSEIYERLERVVGVDSVEDVRVLRLSAADQALSDDRAAVGIQIGFRSTLGVDTRLGGDDATGPERLIRDPWGRLLAVCLRPHELLLMDVQTDDITERAP
jgi:predicted phage baseplate assembly protein